MRLFLTTAATVGLMLFGAASAHAIDIFFTNGPTGPVTVGDTFTIDIHVDTEGETAVTSVFTSVDWDTNLVDYVSGTSQGQILFNASTYQGVPRISQPFLLGSDPPGRVRANSFGTTAPNGSGIANPSQRMTTLTFEATGAGTLNLTGLIANGDDVTVSQASVAGAVTFDDTAGVITIPEPGALAASFAALGAVFGVTRRRNA